MTTDTRNAGREFHAREPFDHAVEGRDVAFKQLFPVVETGRGWLRVWALAPSKEAQEEIIRALSALPTPNTGEREKALEEAARAIDCSCDVSCDEENCQHFWASQIRALKETIDIG